MRIDHRGTHILVTEKFLNGTDVIPIFEQVSGKAMSKCMAADRFAEVAAFNNLAHTALQIFFIKVMPT